MDEVGLTCPSDLTQGPKPHKDVMPEGASKTKGDERYPPELVKAILRGLRRHMTTEGCMGRRLEICSVGVTVEEEDQIEMASGRVGLLPVSPKARRRPRTMR